MLVASLICLPIFFHIVKKGLLAGENIDLFLHKFGSLIENQRAQKNLIASYWKLIGLFRWILTVLILIVARDHNELQIFFLLIISVVTQSLILTCRPFTDTLENKMTFLTEIFISTYLYLLLCQTDFMTALPLREPLALGLIYSVALTVLANFLVFGKRGNDRFKLWRQKKLAARKHIY